MSNMPDELKCACGVRAQEQHVIDGTSVVLCIECAEIIRTVLAGNRELFSYKTKLEPVATAPTKPPAVEAKAAEESVGVVVPKPPSFRW